MATQRRPKHPRKDLEAILQDAEDHDWKATKNPKGYYRLRCPCGEHQRWVHLTPSDSGYARNLQAWLERQPCWEGEETTT